MKFRLTADKPTTALDLLKTLDVSSDKIKLQLKKREVRVNGVRISENCALSAGDAVEIFVPQAFVRARQTAAVWEHNGVIVADKPAGADIYRAAESLGAKPAHRLDRNTSGLVLLAGDDDTLQKLEKAVKARAVDKYYYALAEGRLERGATAVVYMKKDSDRALVTVSDRPEPGFKEAVTEYEPVGFVSRGERFATLTRVRLITGRTHQIRAFFAHISHPLEGDGKYGRGGGGQKLVAYKLVLKGTGIAGVDGKTVELDYNDCLTRLGITDKELTAANSVRKRD